MIPKTLELTLRSLAFGALVVVLSNALLAESVDGTIVPHYREGVAQAAGAVLAAVGLEAEVQGTLVRLEHGAVRVTNACSGLDAWVCVASAMLVFGASLRARLLGVAFALGVLVAANFARVLVLAALFETRRGLFDFAHVQLWPGLMVAVCLATWMLWLERARPRPPPVAQR